LAEADLVQLPDSGRFPKVRLVEPTTHGYVLAAFEVDHRPPIGYFVESAQKRRVVARSKALAASLRGRDGIIEAVVFKTLVRPPGEGAFLRQRPQVPRARFDVVLLIETATVDAADRLRQDEAFVAATKEITSASKQSLIVTLRNGRRIGPVDHSRDGVFLFNFFFADKLEQNLAVWEYTAGWFSDQTGLDNSTLLLPERTSESPFTVINHCRWDGPADIIPSLLFKPSFRSYVLRHFEANSTAAMPILYRLA
jgi:hypothetical protein